MIDAESPPTKSQLRTILQCHSISWGGGQCHSYRWASPSWWTCSPSAWAGWRWGRRVPLGAPQTPGDVVPFPPIIQDCNNLWSHPHQVFRNILINSRMGLGWLCRTWEESSQSNEVPPNAEVGHPLTFLYSSHLLLPIHVATLQQKVASYIFSATQSSTVKRNSMLVPCPIF